MISSRNRSILLLTVWAVSVVISIAGCGQQAESSVSAVKVAAEDVHPVIIRSPPVPNGIKTTLPDSDGNPVLLSCRACHSNLSPNRETTATSDLKKFHQGLHLKHGNLNCVSCHNPDDHYESLRLADGSAIPYADSIQLCAQCHGTQFHDYQHGSHGGMTGYWDLTRGGRVRNHCLHCHDAHGPAYPTFQPAPPPQDRFSPVVPEQDHE